MIESISAITLATHNMARAVHFYRMLGFQVIYGGDHAAFTSFRAAIVQTDDGGIEGGHVRKPVFLPAGPVLCLCLAKSRFLTAELVLVLKYCGSQKAFAPHLLP